MGNMGKWSALAFLVLGWVLPKKGNRTMLFTFSTKPACWDSFGCWNWEELDGFTGGFISLPPSGATGLWSGIGAELCLDDGVPESERQYIQDNAGISPSLGFSDDVFPISAFEAWNKLENTDVSTPLARALEPIGFIETFNISRSFFSAAQHETSHLSFGFSQSKTDPASPHCGFCSLLSFKDMIRF